MALFNQFRDRPGSGKPWRKAIRCDRWMRNPGWYRRLKNTRRRRAADAIEWRRDKKRRLTAGSDSPKGKAPIAADDDVAARNRALLSTTLVGH